jgi:hypothetical protein
MPVCAGPSVGAGALTACEWCPRFFFNSTPGSASVTVRAASSCAMLLALPVARVKAACLAHVSACSRSQDCKFMKQSAAPRRAAMLLLALALAALAAC